VSAIDLVAQPEGRLGQDGFVSGMVAGALLRRFSGGVVVEHEGRRLAIVFKAGQPVHASGDLVPGHRLGELLVELGILPPAELNKAISTQTNDETGRPLLGAKLVKDSGLEPSDVRRAVQEQIRRRLRDAFGLSAGSWRAEPGEAVRVKEIAVPIDGEALLLERLPEAMSSAELRSVSDALLGRAVQLRGGDAGPLGRAKEGGPAQKLLKLLRKPRKPDQLERALGDRKTVRRVLRLLQLFERLELVPPAQAVPIAGATLMRGHVVTTALFEVEAAAAEARAASAAAAQAAAGSEAAGATPASSAGSSTSRSVAPEPRMDSRTRALLKEAEALHGKLSKLNHFELLDVPEDATEPQLIDARNKLAKRFFPDHLGPNPDPRLLELCNDIAAAVNEAYQTLSRAEDRKEYVALLQDARIQGDASRQAVVQDAELKWKMGRAHLNKREWSKARELFRYAMEKDPNTPIYGAFLAHAMFGDPSLDRDQVQKDGYPLLLEALKALGGQAHKTDEDWKVHHWAGLFLKEAGKMKQAVHHFEQAEAAAPRVHKTDPAREARLLRSRMGKAKDAKKGGGGLSDLFKGSFGSGVGKAGKKSGAKKSEDKGLDELLRGLRSQDD
jgi:tetratricopeptide (TPR) repeat protein